MPRGRLAGTGFADDSQRAPLPEFQGHAVHGLQVTGGAAEKPLLHREADLQPEHLEQGLAGFWREFRTGCFGIGQRGKQLP